MHKVILAAALAVATCTPAHAQPWPSQHEAPDEFSLDWVDPAHAQVTYYNAESRQSGASPRELTNGALTVRLSLHITSGPETLTVVAPAGWVAIPESIDVIDGEIGTVDLFLDQWQGM